MTNSTSLICPHCGATEVFRYLEDQTVCVFREVGEIVDGVLQIEADYEHSPLGDAGTGADPFIECQECGKAFDVPAGLKLEFVDEL